MALLRKSLITINDPKAAASEAYRMTRTNIEFSNIDSKNQCIVFTSARQKEGKSTTIANTAIAMAQSGQKVLIIDCDLRKPRMHKLFKVSNEEGVVSVVVNDRKVSDVCHSVEGVDNLHVMTSGPIPPMPSELLGSVKFRKMLEDLRKEYDYIFMDSPPVLSVTDSTILAAEVDGTILIITHGDTPIEMAKTAKKALDKVNANILGVVLTKAELKNRGYYYYYDYEYSHQEKKGKKKRRQKKAKNSVEASNA